MNLIKHIANILALWTIPYIFVLFFMTITAFAFTYSDAVTSGPFIVFSTLYYIISLMMYFIMSDEPEFHKMQLFKTNKWVD